MNEQNQRYKVGKPDNLDIIMDEIQGLVNSGDFPKHDYEFKKINKITRNFLFPKSLVKYLGRRII